MSISYVDMVRLHAIAQAAEALVERLNQSWGWRWANVPSLETQRLFDALAAAVRVTTIDENEEK